MQKKRTRVYFWKPFPWKVEGMLTKAMMPKLEIIEAYPQADVIIVDASGSRDLTMIAYDRNRRARIVALVAPSATSDCRQKCFDAGAAVVRDMPGKPKDCRVVVKSIGG